jgi:hypothetical protein
MDFSMSEKNIYEDIVESMKESRHLDDLGIDGRIILKLILKQQDGMVWTIYVARNRD